MAALPIATVSVSGNSYRVVCPCGESMRFSEDDPRRAAAQANRLEEYIERTGECRHGHILRVSEPTS